MILNLSGELISDDWAELYRAFGYENGFFCPSDLRRALKELPEGEELVLEINSIGGNVDGGAEIYSLIQGCPNPTRAVIQSMAASAASFMIMACDTIEICMPAQMMIHCAWGGGPGNKTEHQQHAQMLEVCDESILSCYAKRCHGKTDAETLRGMMEAETFISSSQAVALGLADRIVGAETNDTPQMVAASVCNNLVRSMRVLPDIQDLLDRRNNEQQTMAQAELALELERFRDITGPSDL